MQQSSPCPQSQLQEPQSLLDALRECLVQEYADKGNNSSESQLVW